MLSITPRLMTRNEAREYLCGVDPAAIGVTPVPMKGRLVRFDRLEIDGVLNGLSSIVLDSPDEAGPSTGGHLDELLGDNG